MSKVPTRLVDGQLVPLFDVELEWARRAVADINGSDSTPQWCELAAHTFEIATKSKPTKRWSAEAARLAREIGDDEVAANVSEWLMLVTWRIPRAKLPSFEADHGTLLRGFIWAAGAALAAPALGYLARECLTKVGGFGALSTRVAHAAIGVLADAKTAEAIAELLECKWSTTYSKSRELLEGKLAGLAAERGIAVADLEPFARRRPSPELDIAAALSAAKSDLDSGREEDALEGLLAVWRASKSNRVAGVIAKLGPRLATPIDEPTEALTSERFAELTELERAADVDALTPHFPTSSSTRNLERSLGLARFRPDPRVSAALARDIAHSAYDGCSRVVLNALVAIADPATIATIEAKAPACAAAIRARCRDALELSKSEVEIIHSIDDSLGAAPAADDLLAAIYADPASDAPRAVYADVLSEAGDPRGEFIALQLAGELDRRSKERIKELENQHRDEWIGVLGSALMKSTLVFRRGFPAVAALQMDPRRAAKITARPEWATIEDLDLRESSYYGTILPPAFLLADCMHYLRIARGLYYEQLIALIRHDRPLGLERIEATMTTAASERRRDISELCAAMNDCSALPKLQTLAIANLKGAAARAVKATQLAQRVELLV